MVFVISSVLRRDLLNERKGHTSTGQEYDFKSLPYDPQLLRYDSKMNLDWLRVPNPTLPLGNFC